MMILTSFPPGTPANLVSPSPAPATWPRDDRSGARLLLVNSERESIQSSRFREFSKLLGANDLLVVNDAATLPASLAMRTSRGEPFELRLAGFEDDGFSAIALGSGSFRDPTERRGPPPELREGGVLLVSDSGSPPLSALITRVDVTGGTTKRIAIRFDLKGDALWSALYRAGRPIQYSYTAGALSLYHVQNVYAGRAFAFELPSAGHAFDGETLLALRRRGVTIASLTHAAGLSSTGNPELDAMLPFPERYELPFSTVRAIDATRKRGGRVIAVGTSVVRALEAAAASGALTPGEGEASLVLDESYRPRVVDAVLSGIHRPGGSHFELLSAFAPKPLLRHASKEALRLGYLEHEFGDLCLVERASRGRAFGDSA
jgi:S-adenosylmethionine:tRNA ribosyltransferase-isomerase